MKLANHFFSFLLRYFDKFKYTFNITFKIKNWDFVDVDLTDHQYSTILDFFKETKGCTYDWVGMLFSQFLIYPEKQYFNPLITLE